MDEINETARQIDSDDIPPFARASELGEFAPNMEIQAEAIRNAFCDMPELSFKHWKELGLDEKTELLCEFERKIAEIEMRPPLTVTHEATRPGVEGYFDGKKIVISDRTLGRNDIKAYREVLDTLFHEGRHAYQFHNIFAVRTESSDELFRAWEINIKELGYQPSDSYRTLGFQHYFCQPVELDARLFAETAVRKLGLA